MKDPKLATRLDLSDTLNYDNGKLKDATTPTAKDGTLINSWLLSDIRTVFTRAVKIAGTVFSGNFDTDNSSQLFDALKKALPNDSGWIEITSFNTGCTQGSDEDAVTGYGKLRVRRVNEIVYITGGFYCNGIGGGFTLPASILFNPNSKVRMQLITSNLNNTTTSYPFTIDVNGAVEISGGFNAGNYYFNTSFPIDPTI